MADAEVAWLNGGNALATAYAEAIAATTRPNRRKYKRYPCTAMVWVAFVNDHFPCRDELQLAMCQDVSIDGISFYFQQISNDRRVVFSLSRDTETLLEARVVGSHPVGPNEAYPTDDQFVIHCEFIGRLLPERFV